MTSDSSNPASLGYTATLGLLSVLFALLMFCLVSRCLALLAVLGAPVLPQDAPSQADICQQEQPGLMSFSPEELAPREQIAGGRIASVR